LPESPLALWARQHAVPRSLAAVRRTASTRNGARIGRLMRRYVRNVALLGVLQIAIIIVMARFATGL
jgi:hypothetical protein